MDVICLSFMRWVPCPPRRTASSNPGQAQCWQGLTLTCREPAWIARQCIGGVCKGLYSQQYSQQGRVIVRSVMDVCSSEHRHTHNLIFDAQIWHARPARWMRCWGPEASCPPSRSSWSRLPPFSSPSSRPLPAPWGRLGSKKWSFLARRCRPLAHFLTVPQGWGCSRELRCPCTRQRSTLWPTR